MEFAAEVAFVAASNAGAMLIFRRLFPDSPVLQALIAGAALHITFEAVGLNRAYCWRKNECWLASKKLEHKRNKRAWKQRALCMSDGGSEASCLDRLCSISSSTPSVVS